jgi:glycosyltransferase involved in cell wall biosynthesis
MPIVPRVTIVVPSFNEAADVLRESLDSVAAQTMGDFECLVIDESTRPESAAACRALCERDSRFRYVHPNTRIGLAASLNLGLSLARAPLIARFDADDICLPYRLERQVAFLEAYPDVDVLGGGLEIFTAEAGTIAIRDYPVDPQTIERRFHTTTPIAHPTVMMRKSVVDRFGGYDTSFCFAEDLDLWLRLINRGVCFANLPDVVVQASDVESFTLEAWRANFITSKRVVGRPIWIDDNRHSDIDGAIVIICAADPGYDWIFAHSIAGLITEFGGVASHMSIRAAEFGLPAAIGCGSIVIESLRGASSVELDCASERVRSI